MSLPNDTPSTPPPEPERGQEPGHVPEKGGESKDREHQTPSDAKASEGKGRSWPTLPDQSLFRLDTMGNQTSPLFALGSQQSQGKGEVSEPGEEEKEKKPGVPGQPTGNDQEVTAAAGSASDSSRSQTTPIEELVPPTLAWQATAAGHSESPRLESSEQKYQPDSEEWARQNREPRIGETILDCYEILSNLGEGGMGSVWLVRNTRLSAKRALKLIRPSIATDEAARERLRREARAMAKVSHPNAVIVHASDEKYGVLYIEMEYVRGTTLKKLLEAGPLELELVARLLQQICQVLKEAHQEGVVHRDLKPANMILVDGYPAGDERIKVLDFGIAKFVTGEKGSPPEDSEDVTRGDAPCTVSYASPEQLKSVTIDGRSDIYSLGVVLYQFLTGALPFTGTYTAVVAQHLSSEPPRFREVNRKVDIPAEIENVVRRCLSKRPEDRPQSPTSLWQEFASAIKASHEHECPPAQIEPRPGEILFGRYRVIRCLGKGGMGSVWLVQHLDLGVERALKLINSKIATDPQAIKRFQREAQILAALNHRNVVSVNDAHLREEPRYIEMEFIEGRSLEQILRRNVPMPLDWVLMILRQLCDVLQKAQEKGIIHRDLKPSNMMLVADQPEGHELLKVLDFGIAKIQKTGDGQEDSLTADATQAGNVLFTAPYASPEHIQAMKQIDHRSDIYSLGVVLYEFLTGRRPFEGNTMQLIAAHLNDQAPRFRERNPKVDVAPEVEKIVLKCLKKDPNDRPQSARALFSEFERACAFAPPGHKTGSESIKKPPQPVPHPETEPAPVPPPKPRKPRGERRLPWKRITAIVASCAALALGLAVKQGVIDLPFVSDGGSPTPNQPPEPPPPPKPEPPDEPDAPLISPEPGPWAVLIGAGGDAGAVEDARNVSDRLQKWGGWEPRRTLLLTDEGQDWKPKKVPPPEIKATRENIQRAVTDWLQPHVGPGSLGFVYFAGQAGLVPVPDSTGTQTRQELRLYSSGVSTSDLEATTLSVGDTLAPLLEKDQAPLFCLLDTSPLGRVKPGEEEQAASAATTAESEKMLAELARWPNVTVWLAATEKPAAVDESGRGVFTKEWLASMEESQGKGDLALALARLQHTASIADQGFRTSGASAGFLNLTSDGTLAAAASANPKASSFVLQRGHFAQVTDLAFAPDGSILASASDDGTIRVWSQPDGTLLHVQSQHPGIPAVLAISGDGRLLASGDSQGDLRVWHLAMRKELPVDAGSASGSKIQQLLFLSDSQHLLSLDEQGKRVLWLCGEDAVKLKAESGDETVRQLSAAAVPGVSLWAELAQDGKAGSLPIVRLFKTLDGAPEEVSAGDEAIESISLSFDGSQMAIGTSQGSLELRDFATSENGWKQNSVLGPGRITRLGLMRRHLLVQVEEGADACKTWLVGVQDSSNRRELVLNGPIRKAAWPFTEKAIALIDRDYRISLFDLRSTEDLLRPIELANSQESSAYSLAWSSDGSQLAVGDEQGAIRVWSPPLTGGTVMRLLPPGEGQVEYLALESQGLRAIQVSRVSIPEGGIDHRAIVWDFEKRRVLEMLAPGAWKPGAFRNGGVFLPDGLVVVQDLGDPFILESKSAIPRKLKRPVRSNGDDPVTWDCSLLAASPDGLWLAGGDRAEPLVCVWEVKSGNPVAFKEANPHKEGLLAVNFSRNGKRLMTASKDGLVALWDTQNLTESKMELVGEVRRTSNGKALRAAALDPSDRGLIAMASEETEHSTLLEVWSETGAPPLHQETVKGVITTLAFTSGGRFLAGAGDGKQILAWTVGEDLQPIKEMPSATQHDGPITHLCAGSNSRDELLWSASMDSTVRLWDLEKRELLATLAVRPEDCSWIVFQKSGYFDGQPEGAAQVRLSEAGREFDLNAFEKTRFRFGLVEQLIKETTPEVLPVPRIRDLPVLVLEECNGAGGQNPQTTLRIRLGHSATGEQGALDRLVLLHNGVPIHTWLKAELPEALKDCTLGVTLANGLNQLQAVAERKGQDDLQSNPLTITCATTSPGQTHVLAIGIGDYATHPLAFAGTDAKTIGDYLQAHPPANSRDGSESRLLLNEQVTLENVSAAMDGLIEAAKGHPEDRIVIYVSGRLGLGKEGDLRLMSWGDGSSVPISGQSLLIAGTDDNGLLHLRTFDPSGILIDTYEAMENGVIHLVSADASGRVLSDTLESSLPAAQGIADLKQRLPDLLPPHVLSDSEKTLVLKIIGHTRVVLMHPGGEEEQAIPLSLIQAKLASAEATNRLLIIDAQQAGEDPENPTSVLCAEVEKGSRLWRTPYLLAARRGELAGELGELKNGLLVLCILRAFGEPMPALGGAPDNPLVRLPNADRDRDGNVDNSELKNFATLQLEWLAEVYPLLFQEAGLLPPDVTYDQRLFLQSSLIGQPFPLGSVKESR